MPRSRASSNASSPLPATSYVGSGAEQLAAEADAAAQEDIRHHLDVPVSFGHHGNSGTGGNARSRSRSPSPAPLRGDRLSQLTAAAAVSTYRTPHTPGGADWGKEEQDGVYTKKVRVQFAKNGDTSLKQHLPFVIDSVDGVSLDELFVAAGNKLQLKRTPSRAFVVRLQHGQPSVLGAELFHDHDHAVQQQSQSSNVFKLSNLQDGDVIVFSTEGDDFISDEHLKSLKDQVQEKTEDMSTGVEVRVLAQTSWMDGKALQQLRSTVTGLPDCCLAVALPDLHIGLNCPTGIAVCTRGVIHPKLIGTDIGCGMSLFKTNLDKQDKFYQTRAPYEIAELIGNLELPPFSGADGSAPVEEYRAKTREWLQQQGCSVTVTDSNSVDNPGFQDEQLDVLGTVGASNHFCELLTVEQVLDEKVFGEELGLDVNKALLLVHSGSRGIGQRILADYEAAHGKDSNKGLREGTPEFAEYMTKHDQAVQWAGANRRLIAKRFLDFLLDKGECVIDLCHNFVEKRKVKLDAAYPAAEAEQVFIHRKGAVSSCRGCTVLPGSRGHFTYIVKPSGSTQDLENAAFSIAHGAGRKWHRSKTHYHKVVQGNTARTKIRAEELRTTQLGSAVICENRQLLFEEMPDAYKNIEEIVQDLQQFNLIRVVAVLRPLVTYKTRDASNDAAREGDD